MASLRFPKVFVLSPVSTKFITDNTKKPSDLASGQAGFFSVDDFEIIGNGIGATPGATLRAMQIHQNVGDAQFGTVRSKTIRREDVKRFYKQAASTPTTGVQYIGYDEADSTKDIAVAANKDIYFHFHIWDKQLTKWYNNNPGYNKTVYMNSGVVMDAGTPTVADKLTVANALAAAINATNTPANDYKAGTELQNYVLATVVSTGTAGTAGYRVGVKIETLALSPALLNSCDPLKFYEVKLTDFSVFLDRSDTTIIIPVTILRTATSGGGFPAELAALEAESQGFDRVREVYDNPRYMKKNFVIYAADGSKYDYIYLQYDWTHNTGAAGASNGRITEQYEIIIAGPTGTLQAVADVLNSWLTGAFPTVTI